MNKYTPTVKHDPTVVGFILGGMLIFSLFTLIVLLGIF